MAKEPFDTSTIKDPLMRIVYETMIEWRGQRLPMPEARVFDLDPGASTFLMTVIERIKKMHADQGLEFASIVSHRTREPMIRFNWGDKEGVVPPHQALQDAKRGFARLSRIALGLHILIALADRARLGRMA